MSLLSFANLSTQEIQILMDVVSHWCSDHRVEIDSGEGRAAMTAALDKLLSGDGSPVALSEAINQANTNRSRQRSAGIQWASSGTA